MKKILFTIITLISFAAFTQTTELKLVSDIWPPFTNVEGEKAFAMDLVKEAFARTNIKTSFYIQEMNTVIKSIDAGEFDGSAALWRSEEREEKYLFSEPYLQNQLMLVGRKGCDVGATKFTDCSGKRLGVVENYAYGVDIDTGLISIISGMNDQQNLERLLSNKIDFMLADALLIQYLLQYQFNDVTEYLEIGTSPIIVKSLHLAIRKEVDDAENIIAKFNEEIHEMITEGTYNRILELNWVRADMDGDGKMELILQGDVAGVAPPKYAYGVYTDQSLVKKTYSPDRFYIDGKLYNSWDQVPQEYKTEIIMSTQDPKNTGIKLNF